MSFYLSDIRQAVQSPLVEVIIGLFFVVLCCFFCARSYHVIKNLSQRKINSTASLSIKSISSLGHHGRLVVIVFGEQSMLLGVTKESIHCLATQPANNNQKMNNEHDISHTQTKLDNMLKSKNNDASSL